jgi:HTH-type transcriptional regulator/antitoxin HigA
MKNIRAIRDESDHKWALDEIETYFDKNPAPGSDDAERFDVLAALIKEYEDRTFAIPDADPIEVLEFAIESLGHTQAELGTIIGGRSRASEILRRKRRLTLPMIRDISVAWHIPVDALVGAYDLEREYG